MEILELALGDPNRLKVSHSGRALQAVHVRQGFLFWVLGQICGSHRCRYRYPCRCRVGKGNGNGNGNEAADSTWGSLLGGPRLPQH